MASETLKYSKYYIYTEWIVTTILLLIGCTIYVLFRPENLLMFKVLDWIGCTPYITLFRTQFVHNHLPDFVVYSLPAGLWITSYLMTMHLTTKKYKTKTRLMLALPLPITAIILELMQFYGWCTGTFDVYDLICYIVPLIVFVKTIK